MNGLPPVAEMERAYQGRDPAYNGLFYLGVRTTGIFCRPTCPARKPLPRNVEYFASTHDALIAGYRPCKRCHPLASSDQPTWVKGLLDLVEQDPSLRLHDQDVREQGVDPGTARRYFQRQYGMTFQAYARARRLAGALSTIREGGSVDNAVLDSGFLSHSGFRDAFTRTFGEAPTSFKDRDCVFLAWFESPLGPLVAGATDAGICLLEFTDRRMLETQFAAIGRLFKAPVIPGTNAHLETLRSELADYFAGTLQEFSVPLVYPGSEFQQRVWSELLRIPYGETRSYEALAIALGEPGGQRAVGHANGQNRIAIVIPCHRVVNKDGGLGGYGGGLRRKQFLLDLERRSLGLPTNLALELDLEAG